MYLSNGKHPNYIKSHAPASLINLNSEKPRMRANYGMADTKIGSVLIIDIMNPREYDINENIQDSHSETKSQENIHADSRFSHNDNISIDEPLVKNKRKNDHDSKNWEAPHKFGDKPINKNRSPSRIYHGEKFDHFQHDRFVMPHTDTMENRIIPISDLKVHNLCSACGILERHYYSHPILHTPVCKYCFNHINNCLRSREHRNDKCIWCMRNQGIKLCNKCRSAVFCKGCMLRNFKDYFKMVNIHDYMWSCCYCEHLRRIERQHANIKKEKYKQFEKKDPHLESNDQLDPQDSQKIKLHQGCVVIDSPLQKPIVLLSEYFSKRLTSYQIEGILFMHNNLFIRPQDSAHYGNGCILAHHMGLGKSAQVIALLEIGFKYYSLKSVIILSPKNVTMQWEDQFKLWNHGHKIRFYTINDSDYYINCESIKEWVDKGGVLILSYSCLLKCLKNMVFMDRDGVSFSYDELFINPGPQILICDEGHILKNKKTSIYQTLYKVRSRSRIVLTGTPFQNNLSEFYHLVEFVRPGFLGDFYTYKSLFVKSLKRSVGQPVGNEENKTQALSFYALHTHCQQIIHRRDINVIKHLIPPKYDYVIYVRPTDIQIELFRAHLKLINSFYGDDSLTGLEIFDIFTKFNLIGFHPCTLSLVKGNSKEEYINYDFKESDEFCKIEDASSLFDGKRLKSTKIPSRISLKRELYDSIVDVQKDLHNIDLSGKFRVLYSILYESFLKDDKVVIFSQFLASLDLIEVYLKDKKLAFPRSHDFDWEKDKHYFRIDGTVPEEERANIISKINDKNNTLAVLILISTKAGGLGINLPAFNRVVLVDCSWNPASDHQALSRVYRMGQQKPCYIYRLINQGVMEEIIFRRQINKVSLFANIIDYFNSKDVYTLEEVKNLFEINVQLSNISQYVTENRHPGLNNIYLDSRSIIVKFEVYDSFFPKDTNTVELTEEEKNTAYQKFLNVSKCVL